MLNSSDINGIMEHTSTGLSDKRGLSNGPSFRRSPRPSDIQAHHHYLSCFNTTTITIDKDGETGYGMKVSGDNPVYVQSVKEGGAAEKAGLSSGDTIIKVNGINVINLTHTEVVELIKAATQVVLTVQANPLLERSSTIPMASPNLQSRQINHTLPSRERMVTAPIPVDIEKLRQLEHQKAVTLKLMLEKEQRYVESLRSKLAKCSDPSSESKIQQELVGADRRVNALLTQLEQEAMEAPPLPCRNRRPQLPSSPPPLPPRQYLLHQEHHNNASVASPQVCTHQRTKSSPEALAVNLSVMAEASKRLIASESMSELSFAKRSRGGVAWELDSPRMTPPGTPPPPYITGQQSPDDTYSHIPDEDSLPKADGLVNGPDLSPIKSFNNFLIQSANQIQQQPIISMEDEDMSDQEMNQMEDHGPFKSLSKLWNHQAHLAVFLNYVISNSDPSSLLFYLVTDLYKEGSAKEMKKWAYEIHSSFLVPGAPLRLNNVDENVAREIDDVLLKESDKEEILRKIFWKARQKAKEELNEQLADFQAKRTAGLGTLFGPKDSELEESIHDKSKETKIIESILVPKMEPYMEDIERGLVDDRRFSTGAALGTVLGKVFGIKGAHFNSLLERCPTYVSKDKSLKARLIGKTRKVTVRGHHCVAHQYYTVTYCNHCQLIIWGIGPQGYQCSDCGLNIHRNCVSTLEENCPGPMVKKERGNDRISKLMDKIRPENNRRKPSSLNLSHSDRVKRLQEEEPNDHDTGDRGGGGGRGPGGGEKRPESVRESEERGGRQTPHENREDSNHIHDLSQHVNKIKPSTASINRSESYKERIHQKRQLRERRKTSDPNLSKTNNDVEVDPHPLSYKSNSGSSSNSSLSTRSLDSPSNSLEGVGSGASQQQQQQQSNQHKQPWDSDMEAEGDPSDWTTSVPEEVHKHLSAKEKKRQEVINELFYTEKSHVRGLKVLDQVFYRPMKDQHILSQDQIQLLFSNLEEMITFHSQLNSVMKAKRKDNPLVGEIGQLLLDHFDGSEGEGFKKAAATFCARQQIALEHLKERRKKDPKLNSFLTDAEMNPICRRLQLKDIIPKGWLRLTKYPLLFENIAKYTTSDEEELAKVQIAIERSKEILNHVDKAVKEAEDENRLAEIQKRLDKSAFDKTENPIAQEFRSLDLTKHKLIYEGSLTWRIANRQKMLDLHVLLLEDAIILLQKQDEKYVLKFYNPALSPIIKVSTVLVRPNAVDKKALFLVNTSYNGAQIYDLIANSSSEKRKWFKHISDAAEAYKQREGKHRGRPEPGSSTDLDTSDPVSDKTKEGDDSLEAVGSSGLLSPPRTVSVPDSSPIGTPIVSSPSTPQPGSPATTATKLDSGAGGAGVTSGGTARTDDVHIATCTSETILIDPREVLIFSREVLTAEPVLTPLEKLKRKDEIVRQALYEKQVLVADILHVPREEFENIADLAGEPSVDKEPSELVLAAVNQAHELSLIVNETLRLTEEEAMAATSEPAVSKSSRLPAVPAHKLQGIASSLTSNLTQLLSIMTERDEERDRLRKELQRSREQLHALHEKHDHNGPRLPSLKEDENDSEEQPSTPSKEVFVDALSGEAESTLESVPE